MGKGRNITVSAPAKIHLLGEHAVVYGKPALLTTINLRVSVTISKGTNSHPLKKIIEPIIKKALKIKSIPSYRLSISSQIPIGAGLGSSAATSAAYIAALLTFLKVKWDKNLVNQLTYEAEKIFHGHPSGADNTTVVFGATFSIPHKIAKNFVLINTGKPKETTKDMIDIVRAKFKVQSAKFEKLFDMQERLVKELVPALQKANEKEFIRVIREGEANLESIGVCSNNVAKVIRRIEQAGGAAKICGGGGNTGPTGVLLCYHPNPSILQQIAKSSHLDYYKVALGVEGLRKEKF